MARRKKTTRRRSGVSVSITDIGALVALAAEVGIFDAVDAYQTTGSFKDATDQVRNKMTTGNLIKMGIGAGVYGIIKSMVPSRTLINLGKFRIRS